MATVPRAWIDGYADSLEMVSDEMRGRLADALGQVDYTMPVAYVRERLIAIMQAHVYESRAMASQLAAEFYDGLRERQVGERMGAVAYDGYDPERVERRVRSAVQPLAKAQEGPYWADDVAYDEEYQQEMTRVAARKLCRALVEYQGYSIKDAAGGTVFRNGGRDGRRVKFARIPRGSKHYPNGCPFCQMLASRGFVYRSELVAGGLDPDHYHSDCQCMVVPSWGKGSVEGYDPHDYDEGYQAYLDQDHSKHNQHVSDTQRNRYDAEGRLKSGDGNRVDEKGALTDEDRALIRSKRTAAGNETRRADRSRMFFSLGVTEDEWKAMSEAEQAALLGRRDYSGMARASLRYLTQDDTLYANSAKMRPMRGYEDVVTHCDGRSFGYHHGAGHIFNEKNKPIAERENTANEIDLSVRELAESLKESPEYHGGPIRLVACSAGKFHNGAAQQLADLMGVDVYAPDMDVFVDKDGWYTLADDEEEADMIRHNLLPCRGNWRTFTPTPR